MHKLIPSHLSPTPSETVNSLINKDKASHSIYFHDGFHNHFAHALLSRFAMGADEERLKREYQDEDEYLENIQDEVDGVVVDEGNWERWLGNRRYYPNYLTFFTKLVSQHDSHSNVMSYAFHSSLFPRLMSGVFHPLIHLGFAMEFNNPALAAEALAMTATHFPRVKPVLDVIDTHKSAPKSVVGDAGAGAWELNDVVGFFEKIRNDRRLDGIVTFDEENKIDKTISDCKEIVADYASQRATLEHTENSVSSLHTLFRITASLYATTGLRPNHRSSPKLDFFLLHALTSTFSILQLYPYLSPSQLHHMIHTHFALTITYYIARGRPALHPNLLLKSPIQNLDTWEKIEEVAIELEDVHVPKVVRTLKVCDSIWGDEEGFWVQAARITVLKGGKWEFEGLFEEVWRLGKGE